MVTSGGIFVIQAERQARSVTAEELFETTYASYGPALYRFCRMQMGNAADAEDILQEVFCKRLYSGAVDWADMEGMSSREAMSILAGENLGFSGSVETVEFDADSRTMTMLVTCAFLDKVPLRKPLTVLVWEPSITWEGEMVNLVDHAVIASFRPSYASQAKEGQKRKDGVTYTVELTPLSIEVENAGEREENLYTMWQLRQKIMLVYQSGAVWQNWVLCPWIITVLLWLFPILLADIGMNLRAIRMLMLRPRMKLLLKKLVDTSQIRAVRIGELEIPLS